MDYNATTIEIDDLEEKFSENPLDIDLLRELARRYRMGGWFNIRVQPTYEKALMASPGDRDVAEALNISVFVRMLRRFTVEFAEPEQVNVDGIQEVIGVVHDYVCRYPTSPDLFCCLGDLHMMRGNILHGIGAYENAVRYGFQDLRPIVRSFEAASRVHVFPPSEKAYFGGLYRRLGLQDEAIRVLREVVSHGFYDTDTIHSLVDMLASKARQESNKNAANALWMEIAELRLLAGEQTEALAAFECVQFPVNQNFGLVRRVATLLIGMEDYRRAFDYLSHLPVDEENKALLNRIAAELEKLGELDTAGYLLKFINDNDLVIKEASALREREIEIQTELAMAELNFRNQRFDEALDSYAKLFALGCKSPGMILSRVIELLPLITRDHLEEFHLIGKHFLDRKDYYRAQQFYQLSLEKRPDDQNSRERLREIYDALLGKNPNLPELRMRSGDLYLQEGMIENAIAEYKHASQFPETNVEATRRLAVACIKNRNYTYAIEAFQGIAVEEIDLENLYDLHLIMMEQGRVSEALNLLRAIAGVDDGYRDVIDRINSLKEKFREDYREEDNDPKMRDLIGDISVGRYHYIGKIGSGGMGVVHRVMDTKLNRVVAMKILREGLANSSKAVERFFREARIAATLNHRNIVNIFDYNINQQTHRSFISMEYVDGMNLRERFEHYQSNPLMDFIEKIKEALFYMSQVCNALQMTHGKGIIHRDIKPDNILIGKDHVAKITDFGIVHIEEATFTPTGAIIGTPRYMSPEQVQGIRLDGRADLYSAGIILYEWIVGMPPFISGDIAYQQVNMPPSSPRDHNPEIPERINKMVLKCLEKNPADRFQVASDLKYELDEALRELCGGTEFRLTIPPELDVDVIE